MKPWRLRQYKSRGMWRWTLFAPNGRKVATIGEGNRNRKHVAKMCRLLFPWIGSTGTGLPPERS